MKETGDNKWDIYSQRISKDLSVMRTLSHFVEVMSQAKREGASSLSSRQSNDIEVTRYQTKIRVAKSSIMRTFQEIAAENQDHRVWPELSSLGDDSGMIDIDQVGIALSDSWT